MDPKDKELLKRIDEVLFYLWDPIGVNDEPNARDEYETYASLTFGLLIRGATAEDIATYLAEVQIELMEQDADITKNKKIADILVKWRTVLAPARSSI